MLNAGHQNKTYVSGKENITGSVIIWIYYYLDIFIHFFSILQIIRNYYLNICLYMLRRKQRHWTSARSIVPPHSIHSIMYSLTRLSCIVVRQADQYCLEQMGSHYFTECNFAIAALPKGLVASRCCFLLGKKTMVGKKIDKWKRERERVSEKERQKKTRKWQVVSVFFSQTREQEVN